MSYRDLVAGRDRLAAHRNAHTDITAVIGPPCSGKTTYVNEQRRPGDLVIDLDALAVALGSTEAHNHSKTHLLLAHAAREAAIGRLLRDRPPVHAWVILTSRTQLAQFGLTGVSVHVMDTPLIECERRAVAAGRTPRVLDLIRDWQG